MVRCRHVAFVNIPDRLLVETLTGGCIVQQLRIYFLVILFQEIIVKKHVNKI